MIVRFLIALFLLAMLLEGCSAMKQYHAMTPIEQAEYKAIAPKMTLDQRKVYLAKESRQARVNYIKEIELYDTFTEKAAFVRLNQEKKENFMMTYLNMSDEEIKVFMARYGDDEVDRIKARDLQYGWSQQKVALSLGKPSDILEPKANQAQQQLWVYNDPQMPASYLYFEKGKLVNWAK